MSFEIVNVVEPEYVRITATGAYDFDDMFMFIDMVRTAADRAGRNRVLMDCSQLAGKMTEADRFQGGQKIAAAFGSRLKAGLIMPVGEVTKLGELAAVNRGARFLVTESETEATDWLLKP